MSGNSSTRWFSAAVCVLFLLLCAGLPAEGGLSADQPISQVRRVESARVQLIAELSKTVVAVFPVPKGGRPSGGGSGVIIGTDGTTLTNYHVVGKAKKVFVGTSDGTLHKADVIGTDPTGDIAVVRIKGGPFKAAELGDSDKLVIGEWVLAMGNPFMLATDFAPTVSLGIVSGNHRYLPGTMDNSLIYTDCIQTDAAINPGNSGGPLFSISGKLVGINGRISGRSKRRRVNMGVGFAIPINQIKRFLPDLTAGKEVRHGIFGVALKEVAEGVEVTQVVAESAAGVAGVRVGDRIIAFQGRHINNRFELINRIGLLPAGTRVSLLLVRDGKEMTIQATLDARPVGDEFATRPTEEAREKPPGPSDVTTPTPQQLADRYAEVIGGYEKLDALKTSIIEARVKVRLPSGVEISGIQKTYYRGNTNFRVESRLKLGRNVLRTVSNFNGQRGWRSSPSGVQKMTDQQVAAQLAEAHAFDRLETPGAWTGPHTQYVGAEKVGKKECHLVRTTNQTGATRRWFFSVKTGLLLKYSHYSHSSKSEVDDYFEDYREVANGPKQPFKMYRMAGGVRTQLLEVQKIEINPELNDALFNEPPKQTYGPKIY